MENRQDYLTGAKQILKRCLGLTGEQSLVIILDESTIEVGQIIMEAADLLSISQTSIFIPIAIQHKIPAKSDISLSTQAIARDARAILICVNGEPECLPFRQRILASQWSARTRIGHMPGASLQVVQLANVNFDRLITECHNIELAMARGRWLEIISTSLHGQQHFLKVDIGSWERLPVASDGIIQDGVWGNVPSGETYIAPIEGNAEGEIVINGSIPGLVIKRGDEILLFFEKGHLVKIEPSDNPTARWLKEKQIQKAIDLKDGNWSNLAEIGIGVNPAIKTLTGNMLLDENNLGTAHIALGNNAFMGGTTFSSIHCDMVVRAPTITIDGKTIMEQGKIKFVESDWQDSYKRISLESSPIKTSREASLSGTQTDTDDNRLLRVLRSEPGRVTSCLVGDDETSRLAFTVYSILPKEGDWVYIDSIIKRTRRREDTIRRVLHVLWEYGVGNVR
jgi:hypothetical protein